MFGLVFNAMKFKGFVHNKSRQIRASDSFESKKNVENLIILSNSEQFLTKWHETQRNVNAVKTATMPQVL